MDGSLDTLDEFHGRWYHVMSVFDTEYSLEYEAANTRHGSDPIFVFERDFPMEKGSDSTSQFGLVVGPSQPPNSVDQNLPKLVY